MPDFDVDDYARLLNALAHPTRLRIIDILQSGDLRQEYRWLHGCATS